MKKSLLYIAFIVFVHTAMAQVSKTVNITDAGTLTTALTASEKSTVTNLTIIGNINARDFKTMRDDMPLLAVLDLGAVNIMAFTGVATASGSVIYPTNEIPEYAFNNPTTYSGKTSLTSFIFPTSITSIGDYAFSFCSGLTGNLTIPNSVTSIGVRAFQVCSGLIGNLTIPNSVTSIGEYAFYNCSGFTGNLSISTLITTIESSTFGNCSGFTGNLTIPNSVTSIGEYAFSGCRGFTGSLTIPNVRTVRKEAFSGCSGFTGSLIIPSSVTLIGEGAFLYCSGFTGSLTIPNSVTSIGSHTFRSCNGFSELNLHTNITNIGDYAFESCTKLTKINMLRSTPPTAYANTFTRIPKNLLRLYIPSGSLPTYQATDFWKQFTFVSDLKMGTSAEAGTLSSALSTTEKNNVTDLTIIGNIDARDFKTIRDDMPLLAVLDLGGVSVMAFTGVATTSSSIAYPANEIPQYAFSNLITTVGKLTLTSFTFPTGITSIGDAAFWRCSGLTGTLSIPNTITQIGMDAYRGCVGYTGSLIIPNSVTSIREGAFLNCSGITGSLTIPNSITSIEGLTFKNCSNFTELTLPNYITQISDEAFQNCSKLSKIYMLRSTPPVIYSNTFTDIPKNLCTLYVPAGATGSYQATDFWREFTLMSEIVSTSTFTPQNSNLKIYGSHSEIVIEGFIAGQMVNLFSIDGKHIISQVSNGERVKIPVKTNSVYIVKVGERSSKVIL